MILALLIGCAKHEPITTSGAVDRSLAKEIQEEGVAVAAVVAMRDLPAPPIPRSPAVGEVEARLREGEEHLPAPTVLDVDSPRDASFLRNEYLGNVRFGGGFVRTGDVALEVRARIIELGMEDTYADQGTRWLTDAMPRVLGTLHVPVGPVSSLAAPAPERRKVRGMHEDDGHDNVNLPRTELVPQPLPAPPSPALPPQTGGGGDGPRWVLVPWLKAYYTHNGGWFLGQTFGCTAGARVDVMVALYDSTTGRPVWSMNATGRYIEEMKGQPNSAEMDQYLLWAEQRAEAQIVRGWLR